MDIPEKPLGSDDAGINNKPRSPEEIVGRLEQFTARIFHELADGKIPEEEAKRRLVLLAQNTFNDVDPKIIGIMSADARSAVENALESNPVNSQVSKYGQADFAAEMFVTAMKRHLERYLFQSYSRDMYNDSLLGREADLAIGHFTREVGSVDPNPTKFYKLEDLKRGLKKPGEEKE